MGLIRRSIRFIAEYFVFFVGLLFIFVIGGVYAFLRPEGLVINLIFLIIALGWIIFLIKYFWDIMDKGRDKKVRN
ncbi:MAG: hypothetical protein US53_C0056G0008 [Candidatus Woesebacteria bacterium GW2011_GWA1_37_7]|uniref:Uncharacterized protein n=1 Tax=Candidatus Woesebacteria bacterium GW2011_GWA1_37_7 TaxID=1618545 RepID=A0A0G0GZF5_9BACT|nr:MAG: hypothetical protein US53_C0056G0008 [Candidatus Woesebacteria bacterium GW2011_GWA1_37_7]